MLKGPHKLFEGVKAEAGCWYSVVQPAIPYYSLAFLLGVTDDEFINLFWSLGFLKIMKNKVQFKRSKFENFLYVNGCTNVEISLYKYNQVNTYFIWVGQREMNIQQSSPKDTSLLLPKINERIISHRHKLANAIQNMNDCSHQNIEIAQKVQF